MPYLKETDFDFENLSVMLDQLPAAVTIFDLDGIMLYYNAYAAKIITRKLELLGQDVRACHKKESSNNRIDEMIVGFKAGRREPVNYISKPYGEPISVTVAPFILKGDLKGCIQHAVKAD